MNPFTMEGRLTLPKDVSQTERTVRIWVSQVNPHHTLKSYFPSKRDDPSRQEIEQWFRKHFSPDTNFSRLKGSATLYRFRADTRALEQKWKCRKVYPSNLSSEESGLWIDLLCEDIEDLTYNFHPE